MSSDFHYMIIMTKRILNKDIIVMAIEIFNLLFMCLVS